MVKTANLEPLARTGDSTMKAAPGVMLLLASCWVLFLQLSAASYLFKISDHAQDSEIKAGIGLFSPFSFRASIPITTKKRNTGPPPIEPKEFETGRQDSSSIQLSKDICFITSEYSDDIHMVDKLSEPALANRTGFRHFLFTNLPALKPPGWTQIVTDLNFSNHIIESRYAKFLGWKFSEIQDSCRVAIYIDGIYKTSDRPDVFMKVADHVLNKPSNLPAHQRPGWMQFVHNLKRKGPLGELKAIEVLKKDTSEHVQQTADWLYSNVPKDVANATEWLDSIPIYLNTWIAYNPTSLNFQRVTEDFWSVYSRGIMSWRDQPIWAFFVHKHGKTPLVFPGRKKTYFKLQGKAIGFGDHTYVKQDKEANSRKA